MGVDGARRGRRACAMLLPIAISLGNVCFRIISGELQTRAWEKEGSAARVWRAFTGSEALAFAATTASHARERGTGTISSQQ